MKISMLSALFFTVFIGLSPLICLANSQSSNDEPGLVASSEYTQVAEAVPQRELQASDGGADAGGGNFVGTELFDDYENQGTELIREERLRRIVEPYLANLRTQLPRFAQEIEAGITAKNWYLESKPLKQEGSCKNQSMLSVELVVRACQSSLAVRLDKSFFEENSKVQGPLVMHELLVNLQLKNIAKRKYPISDEAVREMSRLVRSPVIDPKEIQKLAAKANFGGFLTTQERELYRVAETSLQTHFCKGTSSSAAGEKAEKAVSKVEYDLQFAYDDIHEIRDQVQIEVSKKKCGSWYPAYYKQGN